MNDETIFSIYTLTFKIVNEPNTPSTVWLEANSKKRYCAGPKKEFCRSAKTNAEFDVAHNVNQAQLDLEAIVNPPGTRGSGTYRRGVNETIGYRLAAKRVPIARIVIAAS